MPDVFVGQKGKSTVTIFDADGRETDRYENLVYASSDPDAMQIVDEDAEPKDAEVTVLAVGKDIMLSCEFDGDLGDGERLIKIQSGPYNAVLPLPGEAVSATFDVVWEPVPA